MRMEVGDYYQWRYYEVQWWSGYDFWYFMGALSLHQSLRRCVAYAWAEANAYTIKIAAGMVGGASFLLLLVHAIFFYPLKHLYAAAPGYTNVDGTPPRTHHLQPSALA
jgi:hypothetical protein